VDACIYAPSSATGKSECPTLLVVLGLLLSCVNSCAGSERRHRLAPSKTTAHPLSRCNQCYLQKILILFIFKSLTNVTIEVSKNATAVAITKNMINK
jgi:hypothetical protein